MPPWAYSVLPSASTFLAITATRAPGRASSTRKATERPAAPEPMTSTS